MKKLILLFTSLCLSLGLQATQGDNTSYKKVMEVAINKLDEAKNSSDLQTCINTFERIAQGYDKQWLPTYYSAYCSIELVYQDRETKQNKLRLEEAEKTLNKLEKIEGVDMSEVENLWGYYYMCLISRDPDNLGRQLTQTTISKFEDAMKLNPENPRPVVLLAFFEQNLPPFIKSERDKFEEKQRAEQLFSKESKNIEKPYWGQYFLQMIKTDSRNK